jgi:hypothetical protein
MPGVKRKHTSTGVTHLYAHVLESIFAFASLTQLGVLMSVCRSWQSAVLSMKPLTFSIYNDDERNDPSGEILVAALCASRLRRHVTELIKDRDFDVAFHMGRSENIPSTPPAASMQLLALHMPHLTSLQLIELLDLSQDQLPTFPVLSLPAGLRKLRFSCDVDIHAEEWNVFEERVLTQTRVAAVLNQLATRPVLEKITLYTNVHNSPSVSLDALQRMPALRRFGFDCMDIESEEQIECVRSLDQLECIKLPPQLPLHRLLMPGHRLHRLLSLHSRAHVTQKDAAVLMSEVPLLTLINLSSIIDSLSFLSALSSLHSVSIRFDDSSTISAPDVLAALQSCTKLTQLRMCFWYRGGKSQLSSAQFGQLLPCLPLLQKLSVSNSLLMDSLAFLTCEPVKISLTHLDLAIIFDSKMPLEKLVVLQQLSSLRTLELFSVYESTIHSVVKTLFTPFSSLMPTLQRFHYTGERIRPGS